MDERGSLTPNTGRQLKRGDEMKNIILSAAFLLAAASLSVTLFVFSERYGNVSVDGISLTGMTPMEASEYLTRYNTVTFSVHGDTSTLELPIRYTPPGRLGVLLSHFGRTPVIGTDFQNTDEVIQAGLKKYDRKPKNARIDPKTLKIKKSRDGITIDFDDLTEKFRKAKEDISLTRYEVDMRPYTVKPEVSEGDLASLQEYMESHIKGGVKVNYSGTVIQIPQEKLFTAVDGELKEKKIRSLLPDTVRPYSVSIKTRAGEKTLPNYAITQKVDKKKTARSVVNGLNSGKHTVKGYASYGNESAVEVNIGSQTVTYKNLSSPCVTGTRGHRTPTGIYRISYKATDVTLKGRNDDGTKYASHVDWWMPFNGGIGLHDASWRGAFGGSIYINNGSHGCVNMPPAKARELFGMVNAGTLVVVF